MTSENEDTARLEFLARSLDTAAGMIHVKVRPDKGTIQLYSWLSDWAEMSISNEVVLDDLRMLIDQAIEQSKESNR